MEEEEDSAVNGKSVLYLCALKKKKKPQTLLLRLLLVQETKVNRGEEERIILGEAMQWQQQKGENETLSKKRSLTPFAASGGYRCCVAF